MSDEKISVSVSGGTVYKAVANYLKESPDLKARIEQYVDYVLRNDMLENTVKRHLDTNLRWNWQDEVRKIIKQEVKSALSDIFQDDIKNHVLKALASSLIKADPKT